MRNITLKDLNVKIFADGADIEEMKKEYAKGYVSGFTTNPTLMKKAGVMNYTDFAKEAVRAVPGLPLSFEVFADDFMSMKKEALALSGYGKNVYVKIPVTNTRGESSAPLISELSKEGVRLNVTAVFSIRQVEGVLEALEDGVPAIVSVFAGRIADTGTDPEAIMKQAAQLCRQKGVWSLWASCREVFNIIQAERSGADIVTVTGDILAKLPVLGKDLEEFSLETVRMFEEDGRKLGFSVVC